jgi:hypothetical protein
MAEMQSIVSNNRVDLALTIAFMILVVVMVLFSVRAILRARRAGQVTAHEDEYVPLDRFTAREPA